MTKVLKAKNLVKRYGDFYAVNNIDLNLKKGEVVGLLGPNGAGKTTTFYMIVGLIKSDLGSIIIDDVDITLKEKEKIIKFEKNSSRRIYYNGGSDYYRFIIRFY